MRPTRVIYVENDPALRGIMATLLNARDDLDVIGVYADATEALAGSVESGDVALLDLALGSDAMNGVDLGLAMRQRNPNIGVVIHSQYPLDYANDAVPPADRIGWSTLRKTGELSIEALAHLLRSTAEGRSHREREEGERAAGAELVERLTARQRAVMGLAVSGLSAPQIAERLQISHEAARQDLSRAYRVLVPQTAEGEDRRIQAVLLYARLTEIEGQE